MTKLPPALLLAALLGLSQCKKKDPAPVDQLPPATQTGANTFGCLVNGQVWTPKGSDGTSNYSISYDSGLNGGIFNLQTYRYPDASNYFQSIALDVTSNLQVGNYSFRSPQRTRAVFNDTKTNCYWSSRDSATTYRRGTLTITRLDRQAGIISGTFDFTLYKPGCDSIRVTQGRFDKKL
jgi:hypothetical protein